VQRGDSRPADAVVLDPTPGLDDLDDLVEDARRNGTRVELEVVGERPDLAPGVQLAAY